MQSPTPPPGAADALATCAPLHPAKALLPAGCQGGVCPPGPRGPVRQYRQGGCHRGGLCGNSLSSTDDQGLPGAPSSLPAGLPLSEACSPVILWAPEMTGTSLWTAPCPSRAQFLLPIAAGGQWGRAAAQPPGFGHGLWFSDEQAVLGAAPGAGRGRGQCEGGRLLTVGGGTALAGGGSRAHVRGTESQLSRLSP